MIDESPDWLVDLLAGRLIDHGGSKGGAARSSTSAPQIGHATTENSTTSTSFWDDLISQLESQPRKESINDINTRNSSVTPWWSRFGYICRPTKVAESRWEGWIFNLSMTIWRRWEGCQWRSDVKLLKLLLIFMFRGLIYIYIYFNLRCFEFWNDDMGPTRVVSHQKSSFPYIHNESSQWFQNYFGTKHVSYYICSRKSASDVPYSIYSTCDFTRQ